MEDNLERLEQYVRNSGYLTNDYVETLAHRYPYDGGYLYRGLHFDTQEQFDRFMESIADGKITTSGMSSWTKSEDTAKSFSMMKMTYEPNLSIMMADKKRQNAGDYMTGFEGVVIKTKVPRDVGLDVTKTDIGAEGEVILPAGSYPVEIVHNSVPYSRQYDDLDKVKALLRTVMDDESKDSRDKLDFIMKSWVPRLDDVSKQKLADWYHMPHIKEPVEDSIGIHKSNLFKKKETTITIFFHFDPALYPFMSEKYQNIMVRKASQVTKKLSKIIADSSDEDLLGMRVFRTEGLKHLNPRYVSDMSAASRRIAKLYHEMGRSRPVDRDELRDITDKFKRIMELLSITL